MNNIREYSNIVGQSYDNFKLIFSTGLYDDIAIITNPEEDRLGSLTKYSDGSLDETSIKRILDSWSRNIVAGLEDTEYESLKPIVGWNCTEGYWFAVDAKIDDNVGEKIIGVLLDEAFKLNNEQEQLNSLGKYLVINEVNCLTEVKVTGTLPSPFV